MQCNKVLLLLFPLNLFFCSVVACAQSLDRWAIIGTEDLEATGFNDLAFVEFLAIEGMELVERNQISQIVGELELAGYQGEDATGNRLRLGQLLQADVLLLLSIEKDSKGPILCVVVSETRFGARLFTSRYRLNTEDMSVAARWLSEEARKLRSRFEGGIRHLIAVSPFLSKNLTPEFDHFQQGFATLVISSLQEQPGVAVLEIEEARAIGRELALTSGKSTKGVVPLFVEADFQMSSAGRAEKLSVSMSIRVKDQKRTRWKRSTKSAAMPSIVSALTNEVPRRLLQLAGSRKVERLSTQTLLSNLNERAERFSAASAYDESIALREAALLLSDGDPAICVGILDDIHGHNLLGYYPKPECDPIDRSTSVLHKRTGCQL